MSLLILFKQIKFFNTHKKTGDSSEFFRLFLHCKLPWLSGLLLLIVISGCGLPSYGYLYPPTGVVDRSDPDVAESTLIFTNAYDNSSSIFSGYEIYYKIYDPLDAATSTTEYLSEKTTILSSDLTVSGIESRGFSRLFTTTDYAGVIAQTNFTHSDLRPAFPIESSLIDQDFDIRLKFLQEYSDGTSFLAETYNSSLSFSETLYFYRWVKPSSTVSINNIPKFFDKDDFDINDDDMPSTIDSESTSEYLYISFFIYSFGRDTDDITKTIYSTPVYLGTLKFDCNLTNY